MRIFALNGSPRGKFSNTRVMIDELIKGIADRTGTTARIHDLILEEDVKELAMSTEQHELLLIGFPLYVDSMPGIVKEFFESMGALRRFPESKQIVFLIHSGFSEAIHSRFVERYCRKLASRMGFGCPGVIIKGGSEGVRFLSSETREQLLPMLRELGEHLAATGELRQDMLKELAAPERFEGEVLEMVRASIGDGTSHPYWDQLLRNNDAFEQRFARPLLG